MLSIQKRSEGLATLSYRALRDSILKHELPPGTRLSVPQMAEKLGVSRSPTREAIARIVQEGLAHTTAHKGAVVAHVGPTELSGIYAIREVLEGLSCRLAATNIDDEEVIQLEKLLAEHEAAVSQGDVEAHYDLDQAFHTKIHNISANPHLENYLRTLQGQIRLAMYTTHLASGGMQQALLEHASILESLRRREPQEAESAGKAHIARLRVRLEEIADMDVVTSQRRQGNYGNNEATTAEYFNEEPASNG